MAFGATVRSPMKNAERIGRNLGMYAGQITISSYATTLVECTAITRYFVNISNTETSAALFPHGIVSCVADGISESGFAFKWDATTGAFRCYYPTSIVFSGSATGGNLAWDSALAGVGMQCASAPGTFYSVAREAAANNAVGKVNFVAVGFIR